MGSNFAIKEHSDHSEYKGRHYFFCCPGCKPKFDANPEKYIQ
ncbi:MAG: YHS domain-containing protein [Proteobacteria bacterium]|nr:YHS domain-containing protein [Pseudomonadota bacterium]